jgi:gluconolactonase
MPGPAVRYAHKRKGGREAPEEAPGIQQADTTLVNAIASQAPLMHESEHAASNLREIARDLRFPEGPVAMSDGTILVVEIERGCLTRVTSGMRPVVVAQLGGGPNGAALGPDGHCYVCNNGGLAWIDHAVHGLRPNGQPDNYSGGRIERVDLRTGASVVLYQGTPEGQLRGPNDLVFDRHGGFWFTDNGKTRARERDHGGVYYAKADGSHIRQVIYPMIQPNGIGLSPDGTRLYVAETPTARVWTFEVTAPGELRLLPYPSPNGGSLLAGLPGYQRFDSLAVDADGNVCVATLDRGGITVIAPNGEVIDFIPLPDPMTTNLCFGGAELRTAIVTLGSTGRLVSLDWPRSGLRLNYQ